MKRSYELNEESLGLSYPDGHNPESLALAKESRLLKEQAEALRATRNDVTRVNPYRTDLEAKRSRPFILIAVKSFAEVDWTWGYETRVNRRNQEVTGLQLQSTGEPETHRYIRVSYANMTEQQARLLYEAQSNVKPGVQDVVYSEWKNVPLMYAKAGMPGAIYQSEGQVQAA
ncbi:MAG: hypothetical protein ACPG7F_00170 [Aggregatilineales bacterium]